ncbi:hypothetical protein BH10PSE7_BH10PSE7_21880 [soil metagenome]
MDWLFPYSLAIGEIVWINLLLSGDNAVVIALACRQLEPRQRWWGLLLGTGAAIVLRIIFAFLVTWLMAIPFLKLVGGLLLLWIAVKLLHTETEEEHKVKGSTRLLQAVGTIALADLAMSLDNVIAIAGVAHGNSALFIFGLVLSMPLIMVGATLISSLVARFPIVVWAGAALLGWIAGEMIADDSAVAAQFAITPGSEMMYLFALVGAVFVLTLSYWLKSSAEKAKT